MRRITFGTFSVQVPRGWSDITDTVEADDPPYTLAHRDGVGALQFSVALYKSGPAPDPTPTTLLAMVQDFARKRGLGKLSVVVKESGPPMLAAASVAWVEDFVRIWQISDGRNFAFVTYTCAAADTGPELAVCEEIVRSLAFRPQSQA
jgi:hypothetical protein